ncbi:hypothetical protein [Rhizobium tubonense]|uniref:Uncharacterized protein n=1 Tax=Rhizobium tubonense TaxID=484088 RepID=A0A2W4CS75_9HYPH|nr:hypothetical protein [Rhizobium tubonense]PZM13708.1 hypothetical protein CPY51_12535 [Rhizobium tubonense]
MVRFISRNIALVLAAVLAAVAIFSYDMLHLLARDYPRTVHSIYFAIAAIILSGLFYAGINYIKMMPEEDD